MRFMWNNQEHLLILFTLAGSRFYGTYFDGPGSVDENGDSREHPFHPETISDSDYRGVFIAHPDTKIGLTGKIEEIEVKKTGDGKEVPKEQKELIKELNAKLGLNMADDEDIILYEIKKFVTLALENNPNLMDLLFADGDAVIYSNDRGQKLLKDAKKTFISKKTKFTFSGYAMSQLHRVKGHNKWVVKFPKTGIVLRELKATLDRGEIDFNWINDFFGGDVARFVTNLTQQEANKLPKIQTVSWVDFVEAHSGEGEESLTAQEWEKYSKPHLIDYLYAKDLKAQRFDLDKHSPQEISPISVTTKSTTLREFLLTEASFRAISSTQYNIFTAPDEKYNGGLFGREGNLKSVEPTYVGDFVCQLSIDEMNYKRELEETRKLWEWRTNRNEKRSILEERHGYDTKHCSHLVRLLLGAQNILKTGEYHPRLKGANLKLVREVLNGKYPYEWIIATSERMDKELDALYASSTIPHTPDHKVANELLLELSKEF